MNLLQHLNELQSRYGWLSEETLRAFSAETLTPLYELQAVASFYPHYRLEPPPRAAVSLCRDATCHLFDACGYTDAVRKGLQDAFDVEVRLGNEFGLWRPADWPTVGVNGETTLVASARGGGVVEAAPVAGEKAEAGVMTRVLPS